MRFVSWNNDRKNYLLKERSQDKKLFMTFKKSTYLLKQLKYLTIKSWMQ